MSNPANHEENPEFVRALGRGLDVITAFSEQHPSMTLAEIANRVSLTRATTRRFLLTLEALGYVRIVGKEFSLTPKVLELGYSYLSSLGLPELISPHLVRLSATVHESASAAVLDGTDILYIARSAGRKLMQIRINVGTRFPAYLTSMGRVLLAGYSDSEVEQIVSSMPLEAKTPNTITSVPKLLSTIREVRSKGWCLVDGELEAGLRSIAVPIHDSQGHVVAAVNVSTSSIVPVEETYTTLLPAVLECAAAIETDLHTHG